MKISRYPLLLAAGLLSALLALASEHSGIVTLGGLPVPGATVTATQGDKKVTAVTDNMGAYVFSDLADGTWAVQVEMSGFATLKQDVTVAAGAMPTKWELKIKPLREIQAEVQNTAIEPRPAVTQNSTAPPARPNAPAPAKPKPAARGAQVAAAQTPGNGSAPAGPQTPPPDPQAEEQNQKAADGFLVNGSQLNGASSPFALNPAFGNNRRGLRSLYNFNLGITEGNSVLNARTFSQSGANTPKPSTNNMTFMGSAGGPLRFPHVVKNLGTFVVNYQLNFQRNGTLGQGLVPTDAERNGDLSSFSGQLLNPATLLPFPNNQIPQDQISPQAKALLNLYPQPNTSDARINYQVALVTPSHANAMQVRWNRQLGRKNSVYATFGFQDTHMLTPSVFGFTDTTNTLGLNIDPTWRHQFTPRMSTTLEFQFTRSSTQNLSYFENKTNVSANADIVGNNQAPLYWGPPTLNFGSSQFLGLNDGIPGYVKPQTVLIKPDATWNHGRHNVTFGGDARRREFNYLNQTNPRGTFSFTGAAMGTPGLAGADFADFLLGIPDTSTLAYGNADKYLRATEYDAYVNDDWRANSTLTVNAGLRYEFNGPVSEKYGRLVNLDVGPGFTSIAPVLGSDPTGSITGEKYPSALIRADAHGFIPKVGIAWRPISGSSLVVRAGYSLAFSPGLYPPFAQRMYQQAPLSTSVQLVNSAATPLTLANGFVGTPAPGAPVPYTFGIDPDYLESNAQTWNVSIQRDLPWGLQMNVSYTGIKGTRLPQLFYPNTYLGAVNPCPSCPVGFEYETSNANSTRQAGGFQLRRRLHNGFTAQVQYTYAKAIDDSQTGTPAQNWRDLAAERGLSSFDQRQLAVFNIQYTSGMGIGGGNFLSGWRAVALKEWTFVIPVRWGTGLPETPVYAGALEGTSVINVLRPEVTGAPLYAGAGGLALNPAAFALPAAGEFGDASVGYITGPDQFSLGASVQRTFRVSDKVNMDFRVDSNNTLNHVVYTSYNATWSPNATINSQFGLPQGASGMRTLTTTFRFRF